jgi:hypothetical protein
MRIKIYPNPMRDDGVFVAEDRPITEYAGAYDGNGNAWFPAVPQNGFCIMNQLSREVAEELVRRWNHFEPEVAKAPD